MTLNEAVSQFALDLDDAMTTAPHLRVMGMKMEHGDTDVDVRAWALLSDGHAMGYAITLPASTNQTPALWQYIGRMFMERSRACMDLYACEP